MTNLIALTQRVIVAQDTLKGLFGEEGYVLLIEKMKEKTHDDPQALVAIYHDENATAEIRLVALAALAQ